MIVCLKQETNSSRWPPKDTVRRGHVYRKTKRHPAKDPELRSSMVGLPCRIQDIG